MYKLIYYIVNNIIVEQNLMYIKSIKKIQFNR